LIRIWPHDWWTCGNLWASNWRTFLLPAREKQT